MPNMLPVNPFIGTASKSLPSMDELRDILSYLDCADRDQWFKTFAILGRAYHRDGNVFNVAQEWARRYGGRNETADAKKEETEFYSSSLHDGPSIGALIAEAKAHGYTKTKYDSYVHQENAPVNAYFAEHVDICIQDPTGPVMGDIERLLRIVNVTASSILGYWLYYAPVSDNPTRLQFINESRKYFRYVPSQFRKIFTALFDYCNSHTSFDVNDFKSWCKENELNCTREEIENLAAAEDIPSAPDRAWNQLATMYQASWVLLCCQQMQQCMNSMLSPQTTFDDAVRAKNKLFENMLEVQKIDHKTLRDFASEARQGIYELIDPDIRANNFIPTGYAAIDNHIYGYRRGKVTLFAAHSGMGKTWFGVDTSFHVVTEFKGRVLFLSTEMDTRSIITRYFAVQHNYPLTPKELKQLADNGDLTEALQNTKALADNGLSLSVIGNTSGGLSINDIENAIASASIQSPLDLVVVDYLQNVTNDNLGRNPSSFDRNKDTMSRLDSLATRYNCAILALTQLNNPNRKQGGGAPNLYDIAECTYVVQPAAAVLLMYKVANSLDPSKQDIKLTVAKSRYHTCTDIPLLGIRKAGGGFEFSA